MKNEENWLSATFCSNAGEPKTIAVIEVGVINEDFQEGEERRFYYLTLWTMETQVRLWEVNLEKARVGMLQNLNASLHLSYSTFMKVLSMWFRHASGLARPVLGIQAHHQLLRQAHSTLPDIFELWFHSGQVYHVNLSHLDILSRLLGLLVDIVDQPLKVSDPALKLAFTYWHDQHMNSIWNLDPPAVRSHVLLTSERLIDRTITHYCSVNNLSLWRKAQCRCCVDRSTWGAKWLWQLEQFCLGRGYGRTGGGFRTRRNRSKAGMRQASYICSGQEVVQSRCVTGTKALCFR